MPAPQGSVFVHQQDDVLAFRVEGWATMKQSLSLRRLAEAHLAAGVHAIQIDLRQCAYMDSTFMGTLLFLHRTCRKRPSCEFILLAPSSECCKLLQQLGLHEVFRVQTSADAPACSWTELTKEMEDARAFQGNVLQAHQELANLPGPASAPFRAVVKCMEKDMGK